MDRDNYNSHAIERNENIYILVRFDLYLRCVSRRLSFLKVQEKVFSLDNVISRWPLSLFVAGVANKFTC